MKKVHSRCLFILITLFGLNIAATNLYGQTEPSITFTKESEITGDQENFVDSPEDVLVDDGHVFIADAMDMKIKVFSTKGAPIREMGSRGRGPGEFLDLTSVWVDRNGQINVADYHNAKITVFDNTGSPIDEIRIGDGKMIWPRTFHEVNNQDYLVMYESQTTKGELFHLWDTDLEEHKSSFSLHPEIINYDELKNESLGFHVGSSLLRDSTLFYAPFIYEGKIYSRNLYSDQEWTSHTGKEVTTDSYKKVNSNNLKNSDGENIYDYRMNTPEGSFAYRLYSSSKALFATKEGYLAHFIEIRRGDRKEQGIDLYDAEGNFLTYKAYNSKEIEDHRYTLIQEEPKAMDKENRVYTIDRNGDQPAINIYKLEIKK